MYTTHTHSYTRTTPHRSTTSLFLERGLPSWLTVNSWVLQLLGQLRCPDDLLIHPPMRKPHTHWHRHSPGVGTCCACTMRLGAGSSWCPARRMLCWASEGGCDVHGTTSGGVKPSLSFSLTPWQSVSSLLGIFVLLLNFFSRWLFCFKRLCNSLVGL